MATPYFQVTLDSVASTQNEARERLGELPAVVMTAVQTAGRGRSGARWMNADRALAVSLAVRVDESDLRPFSLMAGVPAAGVAPLSKLKWPNDVMLDGLKVGGVLVERFADVLVVGLGLNLWWPDPPEGMGALESNDPGPDLSAQLGGLWAAETMRLIDSEGWPREEYRARSETIGRQIVWEPRGSGEAIDIGADGGLIVRQDGTNETIYSGAVRNVR